MAVSKRAAVQRVVSSEHLRALGVEYHKEGQKVFGKLLFFGTLLLVSHALTIKPSEFDAGGIKIAVDDIVVVHGALAFAYLWYIYVLVSLTVEGSSLLQMNAWHRLMRAQLRATSKPFMDIKLKRHRLRTPKEKKRSARIRMGLYTAFVVPFGLVFVVITFGALILGSIDAYDLTGYLIDKSGAYAVADDMLNDV